MHAFDDSLEHSPHDDETLPATFPIWLYYASIRGRSVANLEVATLVRVGAD